MSKSTVILAAAAIGFAGAIAVSQGKTDPALDKINAEFVAAFNAKDAARVASLYSDDAVLMPPNQPMVKGRENIEAYWRGAFEQGLTNLQLRPLESAIAGAQAFEMGTATVTMKAGGSSTTPAGGKSGAGITDTAKYVVVLKRTGTGWKMAYDIFNSDLPPPGTK